jgi:predicted dehydrogenase
MCQCVRDQVAPEISTIQDGYEAVQLIEAALQSAETGQWVKGEAT